MATRRRRSSTGAQKGSAVRKETLQSQRRLLLGLKRRIHDLIGDDSRQLKAYRRQYEQVFQSFEGFTTKAEVVEACLAADVVFCGDYHTLLQAQKTNVKILREVVPRRRVVLALECVRARDQRHLDEYLAGRLEEAEFLKRIRYAETWGFPWEHYRLFFDFARAHDLRVVGLNYKPPRSDPDRLLKRDAFAAQVLARVLEDEPGALVWVAFGDLHIAPQHMPRQLQLILRRRGQSKEPVLLFQNNKHLYFRLADEGRLLNVDTVRLAKGRYCILNTPPWIKLRSYLDHLETVVFPDRDEDEAEPEEPENPAYEDYVHQLIEDLAGFLEIERDDLEDFQLYTSTNLRALRHELRVPGPRGTLDRILESARVHYFPAQRAIYLSAFDSNHAAEAAAELLHHRCSGYRPNRGDVQDRFYRNALAKTFGFFGSQVLNPKRKTNYFKDHDLFLSRWRGKRLSGAKALQRTISRLVVQHQRAMERVLEQGHGRPRLRRVYLVDPATGLGVSRALGSIMGDKLFRAMMEGLLSKDDIRDLMSRPLDAPGAPFELYRELRGTLKAVKKPFKSKDEFF